VNPSLVIVLSVTALEELLPSLALLARIGFRVFTGSLALNSSTAGLRVERTPGVFLTSTKRELGGEFEWVLAASVALEPRRRLAGRTSARFACAICAARTDALGGGLRADEFFRGVVRKPSRSTSAERRIELGFDAGETSRRSEEVWRTSGGESVGDNGFGLVPDPRPDFGDPGAMVDLGGVSCVPAERVAEAPPMLSNASRSARISGGSCILCTRATAFQSMGLISFASVTAGGRQQPGQPALWLLAALAGFVWAH
jgi:hypothetical protein